MVIIWSITDYFVNIITLNPDKTMRLALRPKLTKFSKIYQKIYLKNRFEVNI